MATKEKLFCVTGNHNWTREAGKRGRKPTSCPKHPATPAVPSNSKVTLNPNGMELLHCQLGNHDWERKPVRGRKPVNCDEHKPAHVVQANSAGERITVLHCESGDHNWERPSQRGRQPINCPEHMKPKADNRGPDEIELNVYEDGSAMVLVLDEAFYKSLLTEGLVSEPTKRGPGRPRIHQSPEDSREAAKARSQEKVDILEGHLREKGLHISQHSGNSTPYRLFRILADGEREFVEAFSALGREQFINAHPSEFEKGTFTFDSANDLVSV